MKYHNKKCYWMAIAFSFFAFQLTSSQSVKDSIEATQQFKIDDHCIYQFSKPSFWDMFRYIPKDIYGLGRFTVQKENLKWDGIALGATAALLPFDQKILESADDLGNRLGGWNKDSQYGKVCGVLTIIPKNIPSAVYYMGNGGTTLLLSGIFLGIGKLGHDNYRALNTSNELVECLLSVGITTQTLKHMTGRQSPSRALPDGNSGGDWNPFPSLSAFQRNEPNYDAMPSGHIATFMATMTIIATNYPELKWIKPVGYSLTGILAFNMVSGKVHWASDYPIGLFIGYVMGKEIANRRIRKIQGYETGQLNVKPKKYRIDYNINPFYNSTLYGARITF